MTLDPAIEAVARAVGMTNLGCVLLAYQQKYDVQGVALAKEIGIAESGLTRIRQGHMPDARAMARLMLWLTQDFRP
jgi:hypothetical protein